ncbi:MAG: hypothetical protein A3G99_00080 [Candidatus Zambryskibacteria bacterium RIFCSPLOWO2_12_FULL_39_23]|uniref:ComEC/Rec2-related protein domain-containing protein n=1 Tax=Candidatus Zambryskibacteria bacterium RIFCSPLOWO2_12_FULL_39_23 TaxID=1802776 RepID=A0A1G2USW8_9BACT|nr:MAG: hypothetical protein A2W51_00175 [Candidatus Zambryskibacteria bacterium RIFCSPHIGHO2_02_39_10]OHA99828.1 MAG: hypothetical protein A3E59_02185 [Candidatus Zambryskibacteria bacterium RIFCSPHIGHO2_12_FULL_39_47]OHB12474.1 MAG: hypothetical protein A3G99_00080 [Candidatus Zambryskibacteria bacterium RIFCSPLOWO2_12_FULL_39_23]
MLFSIVIGFVLGIAIGSFVPLNIWIFVALIILTSVVFVYRYFVEEKDRKILIIGTLLLLGIIGGMGRMYFSDLNQSSKLDSFANKKISAVGIVAAEPDVRENNTKLTVKLEKVGETSIQEKILITVPIYPEFNYGDKVKVEVILKVPDKIESDDGRVFDYQGYLRVRGIWYTGSFAKVELVSKGNGNVVKDLLFKIKKAFTRSLNNALPQPESSLMAGLLLGTKQSLGKNLLTEFQKTGVSHIVVLSGYNIAIVAESIMDFLKFLPKNFSFGAGAVGIILFTILSGGGASATRAAIMVLVALFAKKMNRDYKASRVLGVTIILMLAPNPLLLVFDPSFQLSVLATTGLIFVTPYVTPYLSRVTEKFGLREIIGSTIATQLTVLPFLIYNMGILSLVSLPVNVLILGTIPLTMLLGFFVGLTGLLSLYLSFIPALFAYIFLWYQLTVVHLGASIPFSAINLPAFSPIVLVGVYLVILSGLHFLKKKKLAAI